jgi:hypothetical protein
MDEAPNRNTFVRHRVLVIVVTAAVLAASWVYAPYAERGPVLCASHGLVGIPCPACGLTRAFCSLAHGRFGEAAARNAVSFPLAALMLAALPTATLELGRGRAFTFYRFVYSLKVAWVVAWVLTAYHLGRLAVWAVDGRLYSDYITTSWTWPLFRRLFL